MSVRYGIIARRDIVAAVVSGVAEKISDSFMELNKFQQMELPKVGRLSWSIAMYQN